MQAVLSRLTGFAPGEFKVRRGRLAPREPGSLSQPPLAAHHLHRRPDPQPAHPALAGGGTFLTPARARVAECAAQECLISFFSDGFPLAKAEAYVALVQPAFVVNDLAMQHLLLDRRHVYNTLLEHGIPVPRHVCVDRDGVVESLAPSARREEEFEETEEYVRVGGTQLNKPFVEKPANAEDHNVCIYYGHSFGGGMKRLFRKVGNQASAYVEPAMEEPYVRVRRHGSFLYEDFMSTGGTDVKVYTVGPDYAHAEARKSPVVDGRVMRDENGKEVRYPVVLTPQEKEIARRVVLAFGQLVCGFDLLRCKGRSYVCDVNGWSFVKGSEKYYSDAAVVLRAMILAAVAPHHTSTARAEAAAAAATDEAKTSALFRPLPPPGEAAEAAPAAPAPPPPPPAARGAGKPVRRRSISMGEAAAAAAAPAAPAAPDEELRCVLAVVRHGDRTPKQKMKLKVSDGRLLELICKHNGGRARKQVKLKRPQQLQELLDVARAMVADLEAGRLRGPVDPAPGAAGAGGAGAAAVGVEGADLEEQLEKLRQVVAVLEEGGHFSGINRKAQLKPLAWAGGAGSAAAAAAGEESEPPHCPPTPRAAGEEGGLSFEPGLAAAAPEARVSVASSAAGAGGEHVTQALLVLKFGGVLTPLGRAQAEALGRNFREKMYPPYEEDAEGGLPGLLRLHSTYRHDLKVYSSDEGRVQMSAAAFAKGLLDLETPKVRDGASALAPILASLVIKDAKMLDFITNEVADEISAAKQKLYTIMTDGDGGRYRSKADSSSGGSDGDEAGALRGALAAASLSSPPPAAHAAAEQQMSSPPPPAADERALEWMGGMAAAQHSSSVSSFDVSDYADEEEGGGRGGGGAGGGRRGASPAELRSSASTLFSLPEEDPGRSAEWSASASPSALGGDSFFAAGADSDPFAHEAAILARPHGSAVESALGLRPPGVPPDPLRLLHRMLALLKALTRQLSSYCRAATHPSFFFGGEGGEAGGEGDGGDGGWARRLGPLAPGVGSPPSLPMSGEAEEAPRPRGGARLAPAGGETFLLLHARWKKLERDIYHEKKRRFDISKVPDVYDSAKYDCIHNAHLGLEALHELLPLAKLLADGVVPNEYGTHPHAKLRIGGTIAGDLLKKLLVDLDNTRDETYRPGGKPAASAPGGAGGGAGEECNISSWQRGVMAEHEARTARQLPSPTKAACDSYLSAAQSAAAVAAAARAPPPADGGSDGEGGDASDEAASAAGGGGGGGAEEEEEDAAEELSTTRLHPGWGQADVNSPHRHVRTRVYFTSESHIHSLMSVLRYCYLESPPAGALAEGGGGEGLPQKLSDCGSFESGASLAAAGGGEVAPPAVGPDSGSSPHPTLAGAAAGASKEVFLGDAYAGQWWQAGQPAPAAPPPPTPPRQQPLLSPAAESLLRSTSECDYLTHIVFRMFERTSLPPADPRRFRLEISFSRGAAVDWPASLAARPAAAASTLPEAAYSGSLMSRIPLQNDSAELPMQPGVTDGASVVQETYLTLERAERLLWRFQKVSVATPAEAEEARPRPAAAVSLIGRLGGDGGGEGGGVPDAAA